MAFKILRNEYVYRVGQNYLTKLLLIYRLLMICRTEFLGYHYEIKNAQM
jgi:hypothetical protein